MHVVATAGHVDHGKSTLVQALTGIDPDRLEQERRRGLSIELGYAWTELPEVGEIAFVDVPGHERFLTTTVAGVGPVPVAMLVVAADDPWMPQAAEHLAILDALGVRHGVVAVTRTDLADPAPAMARAREQLAGTGLASAPILAVSARTGAGLDALRATLASVVASVPAPDPSSDVRLWVDRRFHVRGTGTVVTGTLPAGTIEVGDRLAEPAGAEIRVRGIEALGRPRERMTGPARVALAIGGRAPETIGRGTALFSPDAFVLSALVDVVVDGADRLPARPNLHIGSAQVGVHARPLGTGHSRLTLATSLPLHVGDRAVLRDPGSRRVWGVRVIDPLPPRLDRRGAAAARSLDLTRLDGSLAADLRLRGPTRADLMRRMGLRGRLPRDAVVAGDWLVPSAGRLRTSLADLVTDDKRFSPAEAAQALGLPDPDLVLAIMGPPLEYVGGRIRRAGSALPEPLAVALERLRSQLATAPFAAPTAEELVTAGLDATAVAKLHRDGHLLRLAPGVVLLPEALDLALRTLASVPQPFTVSQARRALGTSRRVVLPLLARLDASGRTVRLPDDTRRLSRQVP